MQHKRHAGRAASMPRTTDSPARKANHCQGCHHPAVSRWLIFRNSELQHMSHSSDQARQHVSGNRPGALEPLSMVTLREPWGRAGWKKGGRGWGSCIHHGSNLDPLVCAVSECPGLMREVKIPLAACQATQECKQDLDRTGVQQERRPGPSSGVQSGRRLLLVASSILCVRPPCERGQHQHAFGDLVFIDVSVYGVGHRALTCIPVCRWLSRPQAEKGQEAAQGVPAEAHVQGSSRGGITACQRSAQQRL